MRKCLVVDDSKIVRKVARKMLEELEFSVDEAEDGKLASEYCEREKPTLILLDWHMPVMNGLEFLQVLRKMPQGDQPIVIFCTTESDINFIQRAIDEGANEYVMKPFDIDILRSKLMQVGLL